MVNPPKFVEPPTSSILPTYKWMITVYVENIIVGLEEVKAQITSVYGIRPGAQLCVDSEGV
jgi:hypothetical protein